MNSPSSPPHWRSVAKPSGQSKKEKGNQWVNRLGKLKSSEVEIRHMEFIISSKFWVPLPSCPISTFLPHFTCLYLPTTCLLPLQGEGTSGPSPTLLLDLSVGGLGREGGWDWPAYPPPSPAPCWFTTLPTSHFFPCPLLPGLSTPSSTAWPATYSCTGSHWWSHQSQCLCFLDSGCRSSDGSQADRSPWRSGYSGGC